jgi:PAS domain S-box-containing protein
VSGGVEEAPVLIVEDYEPVAELERRALIRSGAAVRVVGRIGDALALLQKEAFSAVLLDYQLPDGDPWTIVELCRSRTPRIPVIIVTAMGNEHVAAEAVHRGVAEYVRKTGTFYDELPNVVARVAKLAQSEERLRRSDALFQLITQHSRDMISTAGADGAVTSVSPACRALLGYEPQELVGTKVADLIHPEDRAGSMMARAAASNDSHLSSTVRCHRKDGTWVWVESNSYIVRDPATGAPVEVIAITRDIRDRKKAEETTRVLEESRGHARSAAFVHETLYRFAGLSQVDLGGYARALVEGLCGARGAAERRISSAVDAEQVPLAAGKAVSCGRILDELVTNALEHAFPGGRAGSVRVAVRRAGAGLIELEVSDDGVGLPEGVDPSALGRGMVSTLARELGAEVDVKRQGGTTVRLRFA